MLNKYANKVGIRNLEDLTNVVSKNSRVFAANIRRNSRGIIGARVGIGLLAMGGLYLLGEIAKLNERVKKLEPEVVVEDEFKEEQEGE